MVGNGSAKASNFPAMAAGTIAESNISFSS
jgi:hypothetical protein